MVSGTGTGYALVLIPLTYLYGMRRLRIQLLFAASVAALSPYRVAGADGVRPHRIGAAERLTSGLCQSC